MSTHSASGARARRSGTAATPKPPQTPLERAESRLQKAQARADAADRAAQAALAAEAGLPATASEEERAQVRVAIGHAMHAATSAHDALQKARDAAEKARAKAEGRTPPRAVRSTRASGTGFRPATTQNAVPAQLLTTPRGLPNPHALMLAYGPEQTRQMLTDGVRVATLRDMARALSQQTGAALPNLRSRASVTEWLLAHAQADERAARAFQAIG